MIQTLGERGGIKRVCCASSTRSSLCSANSTRDGRSGRGGRARPAAVSLVLLGLPSEYIWPRFHSGQIGGYRQAGDFQDNCVLMSHLPFSSGLWIQPPPDISSGENGPSRSAATDPSPVVTASMAAVCLRQWLLLWQPLKRLTLLSACGSEQAKRIVVARATVGCREGHV